MTELPFQPRSRSRSPSAADEQRHAAAAQVPVVPAYDPAACLFCPERATTTTTTTSSSPSANNEREQQRAALAHMRARHGLVLPRPDLLLPAGAAAKEEEGEGGGDRDPGPLLRYLHLVVASDAECLRCARRFRSPDAARQHMLGKPGHCGFDLDGEYGEFYEWHGSDTEEEEEEEKEEEVDYYYYSGDEAEEEESTAAADTRVELFAGAGSRAWAAGPRRVDDASMRLPSGRIASHRGAPPPRRASRRPLPAAAPRSRIVVLGGEGEAASPPPPPTSTTSPPSSPKTSSTPPPARDDDNTTALINTHDDNHQTKAAMQLSRLRAADQRALAHLAPAQQLVALREAARGVAGAERAERRAREGLQRKANVAAEARFVSDVPGGSRKHKNRFMAV